jgi:hypothetical protein
MNKVSGKDLTIGLNQKINGKQIATEFGVSLQPFIIYRHRYLGSAFIPISYNSLFRHL